MQVASNVLAAGVQEFTMIAVAKADIDNNASIIGFRSSGAPLIQLDQQGGAAPNLGKARFIVRNAANSGTANALGEIHTGSYGMYTGEVSKDEGSGISTVRVLFGGVEEGLATANFGNTPDFGSGRQWIGGTESNDTGTANFSWDGDIAEILVYSRVLSQSELDEIGTYLNAKYNVAYVPEPSAVALVVVSLVCSVLASRRRTAA
jgi:hypothetical protein